MKIQEKNNGNRKDHPMNQPLSPTLITLAARAVEKAAERNHQRRSNKQSDETEKKMSTMYVISNKTGLIVATITGDSNEVIEAAFMDQYGPNDYTNSYTDFGLEYADSLEQIEA
jgi:hypothetical protein